MSDVLPALVAKALVDNGYDLVSKADDGWFAAGISGSTGKILVRALEVGAMLALPELAMAARIGLSANDSQPPLGMSSLGLANGPAQLYEALRVLHSLQTHPVPVLAARLEARLAAIPETERTREVRQRIGQDVFREVHSLDCHCRRRYYVPATPSRGRKPVMPNDLIRSTACF
jgi:putative restriction endonuclease